MLFTLLALLVIGVLIQGVVLVKVYQEEQSLLRKLSRYESITSKESFLLRLDKDIRLKRESIEMLSNEEKVIESRLQAARKTSSVLDEEEYFQSLGFYEPMYDFHMSTDYRMRFDQLTTECKKMVKQGTACLSRKKWTVGDDPRKGKKMIKDHLKVIQNAFDTVCNSAINDAKTKNINSLRRKIKNHFNRLNKHSEVLECQISERYLDLRLKQLDVKYEMELKKLEEREKAKILNEQVRREKKEREKIEKARREEEEAIEKEAEYEEKLEKIKIEMAKAVGAELSGLQQKIRNYEDLIVEAQKNREKASSYYKQIKSGIIYVISNEGSFGQKDVYRIFMTQSNEPDTYVRSMNPAVPFPFIVHIKAYSENVSDTLERLYEKFCDRRINKVNLRREFFQVPLTEIERAIQEISDETGLIKSIEEYEDVPIQNEYVRSLSQRKPVL